ncbi:hypothetical protein BJ170DRAFT_713649 [Xylariales sp. AK1849]|nr:hypothetical protein BJ170DRAFT_713649 [Xylariales sp. AK1849]
MDSTPSREGRERRTLRRSRFGCRNCKLRKVKCDETKPKCKRCSSFGVLCNLMSTVPDLQPVAADTGKPLVTRGNAQLQPPIASAVWTSDEFTSYQLNTKCQDFITRYLGRSLITPDDPNMIHVNRQLLKLAFAVSCRRSLEECYHWSQSTALLNRRLRKPIEAKDKDPIWGTAAALAILTLLSSGHSDLDWLRMSEGKMSLWHIINPLQPDSLFRVMAATFAQMDSPLPEIGIHGIPRALAAVCHLKDSSTAQNNPYFYAAHTVSQILDLPDSEVTTGQTQLFTRNIHDPFKSLLRERDPVALFLLYLWYRKASRSVWWIELRARVECPSICSYLRLYHKGNAALQAFPSGRFFRFLLQLSDTMG